MISKKILYPTLCAITLTISGCTSNDEAGDMLDRSIDGNNEFDQFQAPDANNENNEISSQLGYVHYTEDEVKLDRETDHYISIDRNRLADTITRLILQYDGFEDVATLVTDEEVLIAYDKPEDIETEKAASMVKKSAVSVLPSFFNVYVSDQPVTFRDIQSLKNSTTVDDDYENTLENIITEMKKSPQGEEYDHVNEHLNDEM
ncbi:YhcN/YlaJ family sporulation lipoprotein [Aquibacillus koreensis]|uniref:YhcN/YlaJ family sporulation lipoprotein n=1 Tax=Aquibacillus koreensis TaxID=279446 RepID=A0A9X3WLB3_9BACI|nr:YhcN/YlaJ family sporulation lipoprotein [Aquibacillus koreensis]MCT2535910.1 YhcN/YlaJ family sporulation lipoprotein [Aquibacillus koreensis]MDC3420366.1 YhcN/YlaJ family sporulation lipoprotein [Aquibacillus koreensis]